MRILISLFLLLVISIHQLAAQEPLKEYADPEEGFALMRSLAEKKAYAEALSIGNRILDSEPGYNDVALYMARIHGWEARYDSAYAILEGILVREPELFEAHEVLVDIAYWENDWEKLESYATAALELDPEARQIRDRLLLAKYHLGLIRGERELFLFYSYDHFRVPYLRNWHMLTAGAKLPFKAGLLSPYINGGYQAGAAANSTDLQLNLDAYLNLGKKNYAMAGYGFSPAGTVDYLPRHRAMAEIWQVLPRGYAISAGLRYFYWTRHFTYLTFSEEKYAGNYLFMFRSYLFFKDYGVSGSYYLSARRYFEDKFNYLTLTLGYGTAPDEPLLVVSDLERLKAMSARVDFSKQIRQNLRLNLITGYAYEAFAPGEQRHRFDLRAGLYIRISK